MKLIDVRELRSGPGLLQRMVEEKVVALTSNGEPFALFIELMESEDPAELERLIRQARTQAAVSKIRSRAAADGADDLGVVVSAEIRAAREERSR
jgi:hypothetical protein